MVTDLSGMFSGCKALKNIDLRNLDTSAVTNMRSMFYHCRSLSRLDLSRFDIAKVQDMSFMFAECENLEKLEPCKSVPDREVRKNCIFLFCPKLKEQQIYQQ